ESSAVDARTRNLILVANATLSGSLASLAEIAPPKYGGDNTFHIRALVIGLVPKLPTEELASLLTGTHRQIAEAAALQIIERGELSTEQLKAIIELKSVDAEDALVERAKRDSGWILSQLTEPAALDTYKSTNLLSRIRAASMSTDELELLDRDE